MGLQRLRQGLSSDCAAPRASTATISIDACFQWKSNKSALMCARACMRVEEKKKDAHHPSGRTHLWPRYLSPLHPIKQLTWNHICAHKNKTWCAHSLHAHTTRPILTFQHNPINSVESENQMTLEVHPACFFVAPVFHSSFFHSRLLPGPLTGTGRLPQLIQVDLLERVFFFFSSTGKRG